MNIVSLSELLLSLFTLSVALQLPTGVLSPGATPLLTVSIAALFGSFRYDTTPRFMNTHAWLRAVSGILVPLCASLKVWHIENHPIVYLALLGSAVAVVSALLRDGDAVSIGKMQTLVVVSIVLAVIKCALLFGLGNAPEADLVAALTAAATVLLLLIREKLPAVLPTTVAAVGRRVLIGVALLVMADYCAADLSQLVHKV